jgi:hypothetical protein
MAYGTLSAIGIDVSMVDWPHLTTFSVLSALLSKIATPPVTVALVVESGALSAAEKLQIVRNVRSTEGVGLLDHVTRWADALVKLSDCPRYGLVTSGGAATSVPMRPPT